MARALINVPRKARRGEVIEIKTLVSHPMETGYRRDNVGNPIPRDIISRFTCMYNGTEVFRADLFPAVAANPFLQLKAARWSFSGRTITVTRKPRRPASRSNERIARNFVLAQFGCFVSFSTKFNCRPRVQHRDSSCPKTIGLRIHEPANAGNAGR